MMMMLLEMRGCCCEWCQSHLCLFLNQRSLWWRNVSLVMKMVLLLRCFVLLDLCDGKSRGISDRLWQLEPLSSSKEWSILKHVSTGRMESPIRSFARSVRSSRNLDEAVIEREIMSQRILPSLSIFSIVRKAIHDELVNVTESQHLLSWRLDCHECQGDIGIWRFLISIRTPSWTRHDDGLWRSLWTNGWQWQGIQLRSSYPFPTFLESDQSFHVKLIVKVCRSDCRLSVVIT